MLTDLSSSSESAKITLTPNGGTGITIGTCDGGNTCDACCTWFDCKSQLTTNEIMSTSTRMEVKLEYTSHVTSSSWGKCTDSITGKSGVGVARITLTPLGIILESKSFEQCVDKDDGKTDKDGDNCTSWYNDNQEDCGLFDTEEFKANDLCCSCKRIGNYI